MSLLPFVCLALVLLAMGVERVVPARLRLWAWTIVIAAGVMPWGNWTDHAHWDKVQWIPFVSPPVRFWDVVLNVVLYLPVGYFIAARRGAVWHAAVYGALLSTVTELAQVFGHGRFPSMTDLSANVIGAWLGALIGCLLLRGATPPTD